MTPTTFSRDASAARAGLRNQIPGSARATRPLRVGLAGLVLLSTLPWAVPSILADEPGPPYGNDICWFPTVCNSPSSPVEVCGLGSLSGGLNLDSEIGTSVGASIAQGQTFTTQVVTCNIARWRVDVTTRTPRTVGRAYDGTATFFEARVPDCQPLGEAWATRGGWGASETEPWMPHHRNSKSFTITPGTQACVYSADVNPRPAFQGDAQVVFWSAPNNQSSARAYLRYASGGAVDMRPYGGGQDGYFGGVSGSGQQFQWTIPATLPPGSYIVRVRAFNGGGQYKENDTPTVQVGPRPTVGNVQVSPATVYTGQPVAVTWTSTNQASWQVYACTSTSICIGPVVSSTSGTASAQSTTWTPTASQTGIFQMKVRVTASNGVWTEVTSAASVEVRPRPLATIQWEYYNTDLDEGSASVPATPRVKVTTSTGDDTVTDATVSFQTVADTATSNVDFTARQGTLLIPAGTDSPGFVSLPNPQIQVLADTLDENDERFFVRLTRVTGSDAQLGTRIQHDVYIHDDPTDLPPALSVSDATVTEGDSGSLNASFTVSLSAVSGKNVSFNAATANGTANAGADYSAASLTRTINAGQPSLQVQVAVLGDLLDEDDETFTLNLSALQNASLADGQGLGTVLDNDPLPVLSVADANAAEGGTATAVVTLSAPSGRTVSLAYASVNGTASAPDDYTAISGSLPIPPGLSGSLPVALLQDPLHEGNETLRLVLSNPVNATLAGGDGDATLTILDDDPVPSLTVSDVAVPENGGPAVVTLTLSNPTVAPVTFDWATQPGTAAASSDFVAAGGTATIAPESLSTTRSLALVDDLLDEDDETFSLALANLLNAQPPARPAQVTIVDDDPLPLLSLGDVTVTEGHGGTHAAAFPLSLSAPSGRNVRVTYHTWDGTADANDYYPVAGEVLLKPGEAAASVPVAVIGDRRSESDETFTLTLANPVNASLGQATAAAAIANDDDDLVAVDDQRALEDSQLAFELHAPQSGPVTVDYVTEAGSALAGIDFVPVSGTVSLEPGLPVQVKVQVLADALKERPETFALVLQLPGGETELARGTATIVDHPVAGDLNGDGAPDLLWRSASGGIEAWLMAGTTRGEVLPTSPATLDSGWVLSGTGDFDGDHKSDLLWLNRDSSKVVVWFMNGLARTNGSYTSPDAAAAPNWKIVGTGDFDSDNQADILWRNTTSGKTVAWLMNGVVRSNGLFTTPDGVGDVNWVAEGVGDFDGDGHPDILWRHTVSGRTVIWLLNGLVRSVGAFTEPPGENDLDWEVGAIADYTSDGRADVVWRRRSTGDLRVWSLDGLLRLQHPAVWPGQQPDLGWELEAPR